MCWNSLQGGNYQGVGEFDPPVHSLCQPPTYIFPILLEGVNRNPPSFSPYEVLSQCANVSPFLQSLHTVVVHCSCLAFRTDSATFVFRTIVKYTSSILSLSRVSQCIMINYN